ncbi:C40 family peptidase [Plantactinospora sp. S1510]|uniref:C40 family peptidase n=1 Tax=Plantactinospora alkalitolerans TaxID=2789879 RepID=A0ABS0GR89_9ACTN|nr:C40 family peptidase [Plantactinospora alkalitolerans]
MAPPAPRSQSLRSTTTGTGTATPPLRRSILAAAFAVLASVAVLFVGTTPALAEPSVAEIEKQIDTAWRKLEPIVEKHNATRQDLAAKKAQAKTLRNKIAPLQSQIDAAMDRVSEFAVEAYKGDKASSVNALLTNKSPAALVGQLSVLDQFARQQQRDVQAVIDLRDKYDAQKRPLDTLVDQLTKTEAELAKKKKEIDAEVDRLQKLRIKAYGNGSAGPLAPAPCPATYPGGNAGKAVKFACQQIGKPYVWGAEGPNSYDCSGLTLAAWAKGGVSLPHNARAQRGKVKSVSRSELRPGDLVFYYADLSHVGMYVGGGWIVHASRAGEPVKMKRMDDGEIHSFGRPG